MFIDLSEFYGAEQQPVKALEAIRNPNPIGASRQLAHYFKESRAVRSHIFSQSRFSSFFSDHKTFGDYFYSPTGARDH